ncbi:MAG: MarR family transcriptional regulator [Candidatus Omnitrophica bacterium]|nr:MarR family transcriptional regulator [Candidatus Omnitrophota bacterium]
MSGKSNFGEEMARLHPALMSEVMKRQKESALMKSDMTLTNVLVLDALRDSGTMTMGEIAAVLNLSMGAVTAIVDKLVKQSIAARERDPRDRRVVRVSLLPKGSKLVDDLYSERVSLSNDFYGVLTEDEKKEVLRIYKKIYRSLRKNDKKK